MQKHIFPANWFLFQFGFESMSIFVEFVTRFSRVFSSCWHLLWDDTIINCFECTLLNVSGLDNPLKYFPHKSRISIWDNCLCKEGYFNGFDIFQPLSVQFKPFQATKATKAMLTAAPAEPEVAAPSWSTLRPSPVEGLHLGPPHWPNTRSSWSSGCGHPYIAQRRQRQSMSGHNMHRRPCIVS